MLHDSRTTSLLGLRSGEGSRPRLISAALLRHYCGFVAFDRIPIRVATIAVRSLSSLLRTWRFNGKNCPSEAMESSARAATSGRSVNAAKKELLVVQGCSARVPARV